MFIYIRIAILICISLGSSYITHKIDNANYEKQINEQLTQAIEHETKVVNDQAVISKKTQESKDALQNHYELLLHQYRGIGLHQRTTTQSDQSTAFAISSQGLRLLEPDAEILIGFARQCQISEIERNDVIEKYNALGTK